MIALQQKIKKHAKEINLLKVEWTYLNQHSRLQALSQKYLPNWKPMDVKQMGSLKKDNKE